MPLDYNAKLSDIIINLREIEGINSRADLISVVGTPATEGDTIADINSVIQTGKNELAELIGDSVRNTDPLLDLIRQLGNFKKWAIGTVNIATSKTINVAGLDFEPKIGVFNAIDGAESATIIFSRYPELNFYNHYIRYRSGSSVDYGELQTISFTNNVLTLGLNPNTITAFALYDYKYILLD